MRKLILLAGIVGAMAGSAAAGAQERAPAASAADNQPIVVIGTKPNNDPLAGMVPEAQLDEKGIASYGVDSVGDLLTQVMRQVDSPGGAPVILINGKPAAGLDEVKDLPAEAISKIQLLPRQAASKLGERASRRVINIEIKKRFAQATASGSVSLATAGGGFGDQASLNLVKLDNGNRSSLALSAKYVSPLHEDDRPIRYATDGTPFDIVGNILPDPASGNEIDPALSALAGETVSVAGIPEGIASPGLGDFAALANQPNLRLPAQARTLVSMQRSYSANGNITRKLSPVSILSLNLSADFSRAKGRTGAQAALFRIPAGSPFSPFGSDVLLARYIGEPLGNHSESTNIKASAILNSEIGAWRITAGATLQHRAFHFVSRQGYGSAAYQAGIDAGQVDPFPVPGIDDFGAPLESRSRSISDNGRVFAVVSGNLLRLPAGPVAAVLRLEWKADRASSSTAGASGNITSRLHRDEGLAQLSLNVPLLDGGPNSPMGEVDLELAGTARRETAAGSLHDYTAALNWQPSTALNIRAAIDEQQTAPPSNLLTDPIVTTEGVRYFDYVKQQTVLVRQISGGNPDLQAETSWTKSISGTLLPFDDPDLSITADYSSVVARNGNSSLPPLNAEVQAAFPDRFLRDSSGTLIAVDDRPVSIDRIAYDQIQWGFNFTHTFRRETAGSANPGSDGNASPASENVLAPGLRVNAFATHVWTLSSTQLVRPGLPVVDILRGGASANATALYRHTVQFGGGIAYKGMGLQLTGTLIGGRSIAAGTTSAPDVIHYAPRTQLGLRAFANLDSLFPGSSLAHGARLTIEVQNLFDSKQRVTNNAGQTPIGLQPYLIDPLGRQLSFSLRKAF